MQNWDTTISEPAVESKTEIQKWMKALKRVLPENSVIKASIREEAPGAFVVRFHTLQMGKSVISESQGMRLDLAIHQAGSLLFRKIVGLRKRKLAMMRKARREEKYFLAA